MAGSSEGFRYRRRSTADLRRHIIREPCDDADIPALSLPLRSLETLDGS
jgi:hypothetical protein